MAESESPCCRQPSVPAAAAQPWQDGTVPTAAGEVPRATTTLTAADRRGARKVRWGIGRMQYTVAPGLYAVGDPAAESPVFVTANYKMSFDRLRAALAGRDGWILVLDTQGVNVWCAAGKGTFGTDEVVRRVEATGLAGVVSHHRLIVPQLGAPGVSAHEVKRRTGFRVTYGPVRAEDLPAFLDAGRKATPEMRRVRFPTRDRLALVPVELVMSAKYAVFIVACFFLLAGLGTGGYSTARAATVGIRCLGLFFGAYMVGAAVTPTLLPWLPGRAFAAKGAWAGIAFAAAVEAYAWARPGVFENYLSAAAWFLMIPAVASFLAMNFTGASTYTSLSGVRREMRVAVPLQVVCGVAGVALWLVARWQAGPGIL